MRKLSILAAAAAITVSTLAVSSSAQAAYSIIRWDVTGFCQIWDHNIPGQPIPAGTFKTVAPPTLPTFWDALTAKSKMLGTTCWF
jgi:hypothetical protein